MEIIETKIKDLLVIKPDVFTDERGYFFESYNKASEGSIRWNDPDLGISWGIENPILSEKDKVSPMFKEFISPF